MRNFFLLSSTILMIIECALAKRPNILFILVDDMGARDLSNEGSEFL